MPVDLGQPPDIHDSAHEIIVALEEFFLETYTKVTERTGSFEDHIVHELRVSGHSWGVDTAKLDAAERAYRENHSAPDEYLALMHLTFCHAVRAQHFAAEGYKEIAWEELARASYFHGVLEATQWERDVLARNRIFALCSRIEEELHWTFAMSVEDGEVTGAFEDVIVRATIDAGTERVDASAVDIAMATFSSLDGENLSRPELADLPIAGMRAAYGYTRMARQLASTWDLYEAYEAALVAQELIGMLEGREWGMHARVHMEPRERVDRMNDAKYGELRSRKARAMEWYEANRYALDETGKQRYSSDREAADEIAGTAVIGEFVPETSDTVRTWIREHRAKSRPNKHKMSKK